MLPAAAASQQNASRLAELEVQELQNLLLGYRLKNLVRVYNSEFDASTLTSDVAQSRTRLAPASSTRRGFNRNSSRCLRRLRTSDKQIARPASEPSPWKRPWRSAVTGVSALMPMKSAEANRLLEAHGERARLRTRTQATN